MPFDDPIPFWDGLPCPTWPEAAASMFHGASRRSFVRSALLAIGTAGVAFPAWDGLLAAGEAPALGQARYQVLDVVAETIMPRTDTPGARDALVPARIDGLMKAWASLETRSEFQRILDEIELSARSRDPKGIAALPIAQQLEVVAAYDKAKAADRGYGRLKALIFALYYLSEPGAMQELRYEHVPGAWEPSLPVTADTRAWALDVDF
ncbi:MAG: gluconate 2-dehydrogenase subunit 3 family protein [Rhizobiaceae bacterium]|nr:MAG: gluconate 2-dehydrogenase subunit 3 family protein [Rhizobiaceae bacterium]